MCRFQPHCGSEMLMSDLLMHSEQSLIMQSYRAREQSEPLNGDGFGRGWYAPEIDLTSCVFTSIAPAWSNRNLHWLAEKTRSGCFFAHALALFSDTLAVSGDRSLAGLKAGVLATIRRIDELVAETGSTDSSQLNFALTDGKNAVVTRYASRAERSDWTAVPVNHIVSVDAAVALAIEPVV